jgi:hypothetical protein
MKNKFYILIFLVAILSLGCAGTRTAEEPFGGYSNAFKEGPSRDVLEAKEGKSEVYIFNITRWKLVPEILAVTDGSKFLVSLSRRTYKKLYLDYGFHDLRLWARGWTSEALPLEVSEGNKFFVIIDYNPFGKRNFIDRPFYDSTEYSLVYDSNESKLIRQISEDKAQPLIKKYRLL